MAAQPNDDMETDHQLELIKWLIESQHNLMSAVSDRAAVVATADAFLLAGITFLIESFPDNIQYNYEKAFFITCTSSTVVLLGISILCAVTSAGHSIWKKPFKTFNIDNPSQLRFFAPGARNSYFLYSKEDSKFKNFSDAVNSFEKEIRDSTIEELVKAASGSLLYSTRIHINSWNNLRYAMRFLFMAIIPFTISILVFFLKFF